MDELRLMLPTTLGEPPNGKYEYEDRGMEGVQLIGTFPNGYGASVVKGPYTYGGPKGEYELAVFHPDVLCYGSPITNDVLGYLSEEDVIRLLHDIAHLPKNEECDHGRKDSWNPDEPAEGEPSLDEALDSMMGLLGRGDTP